MPFSYNEIGPVTEGGTIAITFPYNGDESTINVSVDDVVVDRTLWEFQDESTVITLTGFPLGSNFTRVYRKTDKETLNTVLAGNAVFDYKGANSNFTQLQYALQEESDLQADRLTRVDSLISELGSIAGAVSDAEDASASATLAAAAATLAAASAFNSDGTTIMTGPFQTGGYPITGGGLVHGKDIGNVIDGSRKVIAGTALTGGGTLDTDRTIDADIGTELEAKAGISNIKLMTPLRTKEAIEASSNIVQTHSTLATHYAASTDREFSELTTSIVTAVDDARVEVIIRLSHEHTSSTGMFYIERNGIEVGSGIVVGTRLAGICPVPFDNDSDSTMSVAVIDFIDDTIGPAGSYEYKVNLRSASATTSFNRTISGIDDPGYERGSSRMILKELPPL